MTTHDYSNGYSNCSCSVLVKDPIYKCRVCKVRFLTEVFNLGERELKGLAQQLLQDQASGQVGQTEGQGQNTGMRARR